MPTPRVHGSRRTQRGFKILEVLIALVILGVAAAGVVAMENSAIQGIASSGDISTAIDIAEQRADWVAAQGVAAVTAGLCPGNAADAAGCQADLRNFTAAPPACTLQVEAAAIPRPNENPVLLPQGNRFRVDTVLRAHPDPTQIQASLVTINVCWRDMAGLVRQVQARRVLAPN